MSTGYQDIELGQIATSPFNPRKHFEGAKFDELVASVRQKGVIEPIIVRPVEKKKAPFEIVAGERRFKAAGVCQLQTIPAIVRELTDDEAYDFMLIENLQREDLTELEEAESFKTFADRHGEGAAAEVAEKTGISPRYIRARIAVLALPKDVLAMWRDGKIKYGHCEQLLRVADPGVRAELVKRMKDREGWRRIETVADLKKQIDELKIPLRVALFPTKTECAGCRDNSLVQQDLFGVDSGKASCLKPQCFTAKQRAWLGEHWTETQFHKTFKTKGFRFSDEIRGKRGECQTFYDWSTKPSAACFACEKFVTILDPRGTVDTKQACSDPACYGRLKNSFKSSDKKAAAGTRPSWHGRYFRDLFFRARIPKQVEAVVPESLNARTILLLALVNSQRNAREAAAKVLGFKGGPWFDQTKVALAILKDPAKATKVAIGPAIAAVLLEGQAPAADRYDGSELSPEIRAAVGKFLGADLAKEWAITEEYLQKKTRKEILAIGKALKIFADPKVAAYLTKTLKKKPGAFEACKKSELVDVFLKSGVNLVGRVPDEILKEGKK